MAVDMWVIWLVAAVGLIVIEIFTLTAAVGILGGAALITALAAALGLPVPVQFVVFSGAAVAGVGLLAPVARRHLTGSGSSTRFGTEALVGKPGYVVQEVTGQAGRVRIGGEEWTARSIDDSVVIPAGAAVGVLQIDGATAVVYPRE
ncbi:MAG TPA: NfeD family protein [Pseudonocardia sp.]|jgi:membrane protein implicated in regulation of membrane protease activity|uniref:NfeD family protein n=1 Tax=Pseudonocardia sp. TaxID=60912 RepID=UPI002B4B4C4B|nr:NfeD family protein [Pseudonocardia sp.]HLU56012.1 NfeD family protein [Pseudonocardia sp.]